MGQILKNIQYLRINFLSILIYSLFLLPLLGSGLPAYILAILYLIYRINTVKLKTLDILFLMVIIGWFILKCQQSDLFSSIILLRYYFGFYIFYLFFNNINFDIKLNRLLIIFCVVVLLEAILINTIIRPELLPNYPKSNIGDLVFETKILGFYQRPYSIGSNSTISSTLIMVLLFYNNSYYQSQISKLSKSTLALALITVVLIGSGTGYMLLLLFLIYKIGPFKNVLNSTISCLVLFAMYYLIFVSDIGATDGLDRISKTYLEFLYDFKLLQIDDVKRALMTDVNQLYVGKKFDNPSELIIWSDFAWNDLFYCTGYIGLLTTILIYFFKTNKYNWIPILIFLLGAIHYGAMYSLPGQLLIGYFFSSKFKAKVRRDIISVEQTNKKKELNQLSF